MSPNRCTLFVIKNFSETFVLVNGEELLKLVADQLFVQNGFLQIT